LKFLVDNQLPTALNGVGKSAIQNVLHMLRQFIVEDQDLQQCLPANALCVFGDPGQLTSRWS